MVDFSTRLKVLITLDTWIFLVVVLSSLYLRITSHLACYIYNSRPSGTGWEKYVMLWRVPPLLFSCPWEYCSTFPAPMLTLNTWPMDSITLKCYSNWRMLCCSISHWSSNFCLSYINFVASILYALVSSGWIASYLLSTLKEFSPLSPPPISFKFPKGILFCFQHYY